MTSYFLFTPNLSHAFIGSYTQCLHLARELIADGSYELLKVARSRAGENQAIVIYDISAESTRQTRGVRGVDRRKLQKTSKLAPLVILEDD